MPRPGRKTTERAKDFKGTLLQLLKTMGAYKISLIVVIVFAILSTIKKCTFFTSKCQLIEIINPNIQIVRYFLLIKFLNWLFSIIFT